MAGVQLQPAPYTTINQLLLKSPQDQEAYISKYDPASQEEIRAELAQAKKDRQRQQNVNFMGLGKRKQAPCRSLVGSSLSQNYVSGSTLQWEMPEIPGGVAVSLIFTTSVVLNFAAGTGATYGLSPAAPQDLFQTLTIAYNGPQITTDFYVPRVVNRLRGYGRTDTSAVIAGQSVTAIQNLLATTFPVTSGANTWTFKQRVNLTPTPLDIRGALPINQKGNAPQIKLLCAQTLLGGDPFLNIAASTGGTGNAITVTSGTVKVDCEYIDGQQPNDLTPLTPDFSGLETWQGVTDIDLSPLNANQVQYQKLTFLNRQTHIIAVVIDAVQSTKFAAATNFLGLALAADYAGNVPIQQYGLSSNIDVANFWEQRRNWYEQDADEGVLVWFQGLAEGAVNPSGLGGHQAFDLQHAYSALSHGVQMTTVGGVSGVNPRVRLYAFGYNEKGLG